MIEKRRVNGLTHCVVSAERERDIAHTAAHLDGRHPCLDLPRRFDEVHGVVVVLFGPRRHGQDVRVEYDVRQIEPDLLRQDPVGPFTDRYFAVDRRGLPLLVERHHDDSRSVSATDIGRLDERLLPLLQTD